jgi:hypothetical protein
MILSLIKRYFRFGGVPMTYELFDKGFLGFESHQGPTARETSLRGRRIRGLLVLFQTYILLSLNYFLACLNSKVQYNLQSFLAYRFIRFTSL